MSGSGRDDALAATSAGEGVGSGRPIPAELQRGDVVGRYVVLGRIGAGGMGVVHAAHDRELDRKVALKLVRASSRSGTEDRARLLAEAQALAKLSHPNVVAVHDAGTLGDAVWIAMELVEGKTFDAWCRERPRGLAELLDAVVDAGRGLAAAHAVGLVHRDIKPDNVMVARDPQGARAYRVRVMDFGLASPSVPRRAGAGVLVGTPAYMSPEQLTGLEVDARTDQFSLCLMLWEAIYGDRPFRGDNVLELAANVIAGKLDAPRSPRMVPPRWLRAVLRRGLAVDPEARFVSMEELLAQLSRGRARSRRERVAIAVAAGALAIATPLLWRAVASRERELACVAAAGSIDTLWNDEQRTHMRAAFEATEMSYAADSFEHLAPRLDEWSESWRRASETACQRTATQGWSASIAERASGCLDERRWALEGLLGVLAAPDAPVVRRAVQAVVALPDVASCLDADRLERRLALPSDAAERERAEQLRRELVAAVSLDRAGRYAEGSVGARAVLDGARELGWAPLIAEAQVRVGAFEERTAAYAQAERTLVEAYFVAFEVGAETVAADAAARLTVVVGERLARPVEGMLWGRHAAGMRARLPEEPLRSAELWQSLAIVHHRLGEYDQALALNERALATLERELGSDHPDLSSPLQNLATAYALRGEYERAKGLYQRALVIRETAVGPDHPDVAAVLTNLANVNDFTGERALAEQQYRRALAIQETTFGRSHVEISYTLTNLGIILELRGELDEAGAMYERAYDIQRAALGEDHPSLATVLGNMASLQASRGNPARAIELYQRAVAILGASLGPDHPDLALALVGLGTLLLENGRAEEAVPMLQRALELRMAIAGETARVAAARFLLARAMWAAGRDRTLARELAERALAELGDGDAQGRAEIQRWLDAPE